MPKKICPECNDIYPLPFLCPVCFNGRKYPYRIEDSEEYQLQQKKKREEYIKEIMENQFKPLLKLAIECLIDKKKDYEKYFYKNEDLLIYFPKRNNPYYFKLEYDLFKKANEIALKESNSKLTITTGSGFRLEYWDIGFIIADERFEPIVIKPTKTNLNKIIKWSTSRYNEYKKKDVVNIIYDAIKNKENIELGTGSYTERGGCWGRTYELIFEDGIPILYENKGLRLEKKYILKG